jgi:hypothetical protein
VTEEGWSRRGCWRGCLWLLLFAFLLFLLLLLLSQCTPTGCSDDREPAPKLSTDEVPGKPSYREPKAQEWWQEETQTEEKKARSGQVTPLEKRKPIAPGRFEVYVHKPAELLQRPPAVGLHLGLRYHGEGQVKEVTWTLSDGVKEQGEFLDELVPFDRDLVASTEIDVTYTYVDANGVEKEDGFSFRYVLEGKVTFSERITTPEDKRTPAQKEAEREGEKKKKDAKDSI